MLSWFLLKLMYDRHRFVLNTQICTLVMATWFGGCTVCSTLFFRRHSISHSFYNHQWNFLRPSPKWIQKQIIWGTGY